MLRIYDQAGNERDLAWLHATFGPEVRAEPRPDPTKPGYECIALIAKAGPCTLVAKVLAQDGSPQRGVQVARWWDDPGLPILPDAVRTWRQRGVSGATNDQGDIGFGMGGGDKYNPAGPGYPVSEIWPQGNSGRVHGLGWLMGTEHLHLDSVFQLQEPEDALPPEPPVEPPPNGLIAAQLRVLAMVLNELADLLA